MSSSLFEEGGEFGIRRTGSDKYSMSITLPADPDGRTPRECPSADCSPGYFKVKMGTGITGGQEVAYCPYCRHAGDPSDFTTKDQLRYAEEVAIREAEKQVGRMTREAFGLGPTGRRKFGGGLVSFEVSYKADPPRHVHRPLGEELKRDVVCPNCTLDHSVFGLAVWCHDCGKDVFMTHVRAEFNVVQRMLSDVDRRMEMLGARVAARDVENCLEDIVSIFEAVLRALMGRHARAQGLSPDQIEDLLKKIGNRFQSVSRSQEVLRKEFGLDLFAGMPANVVRALEDTFEKRHPITHNLGVLDRKYLDRIRSSEQEGREIRVTPDEITAATTICLDVLGSLHTRLFPGKDEGQPPYVPKEASLHALGSP